MSSNIVMDGVSTMDTGSSGSALFNMNNESIAEVKVLESGYQAEYGLRSGLQVMAVTKSGTNRFRGSVYNVRRNSEWNSNSETNIQNGVAEDPYRRHRTSGSRSAVRSASRAATTNSSSSLPRSSTPRPPAARSRRSGCRPRWSAKGDFSQTTDNLGNPFPYIKDPQSSGACAVHRGGRSQRMLRGWWRAREDSGQPALSASG